MAKSLEETHAAFSELKTAMTEQAKEVADLIVAVNALLEKEPADADLQPLHDEIVSARDTLLADNPNVKEALDKVSPPEPPIA